MVNWISLTGSLALISLIVAVIVAHMKEKNLIKMHKTAGLLAIIFALLHFLLIQLR